MTSAPTLSVASRPVLTDVGPSRLAVPSEKQLARRSKSRLDACFAAKNCEEFRGKDTIVLDLTGVTPVMDYFVITTATNPRQMAAIANEVRVQLKGRGNPPPNAEGEKQSNWLLQDWGDIVVHIMLPEARELYDLEHLWADAVRVDWAAVNAGAVPVSPAVGEANRS